jgi:hypothetical protein
MNRPWETPGFQYLKHNASDVVLLGILFSGDMPISIREASELVLTERGWIPDGSLHVLVDPPPGDSGVRYMGIPCAQPE